MWTYIFFKSMNIHHLLFVFLGPGPMQLSACMLSCVQLFATPCTVARQAPLSMEFSKNTGVGCHFLPQRIFPIQGWNLSLLHILHWQVDFSRTEPPGNPLFYSYMYFIMHLYIHIFIHWALYHILYVCTYTYILQNGWLCLFLINYVYF